MSNSVTTIGFKEFDDKLKKASERIKREANAEVSATGRDWAKLAIRSAPVNYGFLRQQIKSVDLPGRTEVISPVYYSPYMEWGTGTKVSVPADLQDYAIQFKGQKQVVGIRPHPYFFIHKQAMTELLVKRLNEVLKFQ